MLVFGLAIGWPWPWDCGLGLGIVALALGLWPWPWDCGLGLKGLSLAENVMAKILRKTSASSTKVNRVCNC